MGVYRRPKLRIMTNEYRIPYSTGVPKSFSSCSLLALALPLYLEVRLPQITSFVNTLVTFLLGMVT